MKSYNITSEEGYIKNLENLLINYNLYDIVEKEYYEWSCLFNNNYNNNNNEFVYYISPIYKICGKKWQIIIKDIYDPYVALILRLVPDDKIKDNEKVNINEEVNVKFIISFRNHRHFIPKVSSFHCFNKENKYQYEFILEKYTFKKDIVGFLMNKNSKMDIGVYIQIYKENVYEYIKEIRSLIKNDSNRKIIGEDLFECPLVNWSSVGALDRSPEFEIGGNIWKIQFNRTNIKKNIVTFRLINSSVDDNTGLIFVNLVLCIRKFYELHPNESKVFISFQCFNKTNNEYTFEKELNPGTKELIENGEAIFGFYIRVYNNAVLF